MTRTCKPTGIVSYGGRPLQITARSIRHLAAAYGFGLSRNDPFVDGNKRVAFQALYVFLGLNGWRVVAEEPEAVRLMLDVASGAINESGLADWLRDHIEPR